MRRRSTLGMGIGVAPVRTGDVPELEPAVRTSRHSVVPRQLSFNSNSSRCSNSSGGPGRRRSVLSGASTFRTSRTNLNERPNANDSVLDGIAELDQSMSESSLTTKDSTKVASNCQQSTAVVTTSHLSSIGPSSKRSVTKTFNKPTIANKSSASKTETVSKIPRCKTSTSKSSATPMAQLNSTAGFEEAEIAAMTSTPHPTRSVKHSAGHSSMVDLGDFTEQMKLFFADQRSMMQVLKLSFEKLNKLAVSQLNLNVLMIDLLNEFKSQQGSCKSAQNTACSTNDLASSSNGLETKPEDCISNVPLNVLAPSHEDNKENFSALSLKPEDVYNCMKSQLHCLRTPTALKFGGHQRVHDTPNTLLSNKIHHQLENLFETRETE